MSIKIIDNLTLDIYVKKEFIKNIDFKTKEGLEKYLRKLFKTMKEKYNITIEGFYEIVVYIDKYYGVIFHLEKEELEYYDYFKNQVDMRITTVDIDFLYLVDDIPKNIINKVNILSIDNNIYLKIIKKLNKVEMMELVENSRLIYDI